MPAKRSYYRACCVLQLCGISLVLASLVNLLGLFSFWTTFLLAWGLSVAFFLNRVSSKIFPIGKAVLITGCDSGFGNAVALHLLLRGFRVFAGCHNASSSGAKKLRRRAYTRLHVLQLDVTSHDQILDALQEVKRLLQVGEVLWGVINNAGINEYGCVEWVSMDAYRRTAEVNLFGTIAVTKAFLPLIRSAKGRIVNVGSCRGRMAFPLGSTHDVTKWGIEAFTHALRIEMRRFDVKVCLIELGNFTQCTNIFTEESVRRLAKEMWDQMPGDVKDAYGKEFFDDATEHQVRHSKSGNVEASVVMETFSEALMQMYPQSRYQPMDPFHYVMLFVRQHFPEWVFDFVYIECPMK